MSDKPVSDPSQDQTTPGQSEAPHSQLLERLLARRRRPLITHPPHRLPVGRAQRPIRPVGADAPHVALTAHRTLALVQRMRHKGRRSAVWAPQVGAIAPITFHRFAAQIMQRAHILHPLSIPKPASSAGRAGPAALELALPTGGAQPGLTLPGEIGPGGKISLPSPFSIAPPAPQPGGQVIQRMAAPSAGETSRPSTKIPPLAPVTRPPERTQAKKLPPKSRLYCRV